MTGPRGDMAPEFEPIGQKVEYVSAEVEWWPVQGKPNFWRNRKGQLKYAPPPGEYATPWPLMKPGCP